MSLAQDFRYGVRSLVASRNFTVVALLCLALGIGATTAIFSVVNAVVLRPLPYADADRLVRVYTEFRGPAGTISFQKFWLSRAEYLLLKRESQSWESFDGYTTFGANIAGGGAAQPVRATIANVTGGLFTALGARPILGRVITPQDDTPAAPATAVLSYGLWQRAFGGDRNIAGREIQINGAKATVLGVMGPGFELPPGDPNPPELWSAWQIDPASPGPASNHLLSAIAKRKRELSLEQVRGEMDRVVARTDAAGKNHRLNLERHPVVMYPLHGEVVGGVRSAMLMLLGAVGFVLLISCVNVANLLLARAEARQREIAIRQAMGAGAGRLTRQFVIEGLTLALAGAALGAGLAWAGLKLILSLGATAIPRAAEIRMDWQVLAFTLGVSVLTGVLFGLAPLAQTTAANVYEVLKSASGRTTASAAASMFRRVLVVGELALALVLLIGTGLMVRAFWKLQQVNVGVETRGVLTMQIALPAPVYATPESVAGFWNAVEERVSALPGVESATLVSGLAPQRQLQANDTEIENFTPVPGGPGQNIDYWQIAGRRFFETMKARLVEGRYFDERDGRESPPVLIVNQTTARAYWPGQSAVGKRMRPGFQGPWRTIVGVIGDVKNAGLDKPTGTEIYFPLAQAITAQSQMRTGFVVIRAAGNRDPQLLANPARQAIQSIDPSLPVARIRTLDEIVSAAQGRPRFLTVLLTLFSGVALGLAAIGIYGVISYSVAQRTNEFGIRMAMGALPRQVLSLVLRQGLMLGAMGLVAGLAGASLLTRSIESLLYGATALDPLTFAAMAALLLAVTLAACWIPARRATRVDPVDALRYE